MDLSRLERYKTIIDDWQQFSQALSRPLPVTIWTNLLRTTPHRLEKSLLSRGQQLVPLHWRNDAFKLLHTDKPGHRIEYITGHYHVQEESSQLPVYVLAPQPGERILDMCAAPGNKTAQLAVQMKNTGTIVANDRDYRRMKAVGKVIDRLGLLNITLTTYDAANYPLDAGLFDKVLADVPCSCEGTSRKNPEVLLRQNPHHSSNRLPSLQKAILRKAIALCKPGGLVVYSTCTYAPEENEMVVDNVMREVNREDQVISLVPANIPGFKSHPGLTAWNDLTFHPSLRHAMRVYPHTNDTGGFFIAALKKLPLEDMNANSGDQHI